MLGAMSGKDYINSKVSLIDAVSNAILSSVEVKTSTANQYRGEIQSHGFMQMRLQRRWLRRAVPSDAQRLSTHAI
jgi:hypothetical protein